MSASSGNDNSIDHDLELALQLSRLSYEVELRRRSRIVDDTDAGEDLISLEDTGGRAWQEQVDDINRLFETLPQQTRLYPSLPSSPGQPVYTTEWCTTKYPRATNLPPSNGRWTDISSPYIPLGFEHLGYSGYSGSSTPTASFPPPPTWSDSLPQPHLSASNATSLTSTRPMASVSGHLIVPFRPLSTRLMNGDLIDLGSESSEVDCRGPLTYEQLREEFDPLCVRNSDSGAQPEPVRPLPTSLSSGRVEQATAECSMAFPVLERSLSITSTHSEVNSKPGRPPPPKPPRLSKPAPRSGSVDSKRRSFPASGLSDCDVANLALTSCVCEIDRQIESLRRRGPKKQDPVARRFISPVVDYLITSFNVTSVKVIVEKDFSWPSSRFHTDNKMVFTCETRSTIQEILANVLNTFLDPTQIERCNGCLPVDEYGLKIYGLDEFLLNSSLLGENPFVGQALAFGKDIRLEVGKISTPQYGAEPGIDVPALDDVISYSPSSSRKSKKSSAIVVTKEMVQEVIDTLKKEVYNCSMVFREESALTCRRAVTQSVKLLCTLLGRIVTNDLSVALRSYNAASTSEQLSNASQKLTFAVHQFIGRFCKSVHCDFDVLPLKPSLFDGAERKKREVVGVDEFLLVHVDSVHNIPAEWAEQYSAFYVALHVMHGTAELCRGFKENPKPIVDGHFFPYCRTNTWATFDVRLCVLPRETRLFVLLYGTYTNSESQTPTSANNGNPSSSVDVPAVIERQLACASFPLFDHEGYFRQGSLLLNMGRIEGSVVQPWGPRPLFEEVGDLVAVVNLPQFHYDIIFPHVGFGEASVRHDFTSLHLDMQQYLLDIIEGGVTHSLSQDEKEVLWEKRHYLTHIPEALPLVLASAVGWDWASLNNIYQVVDDWVPLNPVQAIEIFLPHFPDLIIREKAIYWLKSASSDFLFNFLPQLVEALRFEAFENSSLACFLMSLSAGDRRFAFELYWQLQQRIDHCCERPFGRRCEILQRMLFEIADEKFQSEIANQHCLLRALNSIASDMKEAGENTKMLSVLQRHLSILDARLLETNVRLPILPSFLCIGVNVSESNFFNSLTKPVKICFKGLKSSFGVLYKIGDDVRQDALVLQLVKVMNDIWLSQELDLRMIIFRCMPIGNKKGLIELVPDCRTLCEIQSAQGAAGVFKDDVLKNWLEKQNPTEFQYKIALENFQLSCAGWCVATYVLGIGDRHNDNILVTTTGHVFHIDFGKYMGDWQMAAGFRRDRVPFIFTSDMAYVINEGSSQSATGHYQHFVDNCCKAFNLLRKRYSLLVNLMKLMSCSDIPGMDIEAVNFVQNNLLLNLTDTEATVQFTRMIQESLRSKFPRLNFFAHTLVQLKNSPSMIRGGYDDPNKLSFIPQLFTEHDDGRIVGVVVLAFEKWHTPDKIYMYKLEVKRVNEAVCSIVYRSFAEFNELYVKLCRRFPIARLPPLSRGSNMGRSNIRSVAERRRFDIQRFMNLLFDHHFEVAHCDLVYTFFHIIFRDSAPEESNKLSQRNANGESHPTTSVTGSISLRLSFNQQKSILSVFVGHVKDLKPINGQAPDSYVKTYLHPDMQRASKRKTRVVKNTQMPTFNEELTYQLDGDANLAERVLEVSVWNCGSLVGENSMIGTIHIPLRRLSDVATDRKGVKTLESWFQLSGYMRH